MQVRRDHGPRLGADGGAHVLRRERPVARSDVDQHRPRADCLDGAEVSGKVVTGQDHLVAVADAQPAQRRLDGIRARAAEQHVLDTVVVR